MTNVVLVCVAGVSGTFLAKRMRDIDPTLSVTVTTFASLVEVGSHADAVLVAPQLADSLDAVSRVTSPTPLMLLPGSAYGVAGADTAVRAVRELIGSAAPTLTDHTITTGKKD